MITKILTQIMMGKSSGHLHSAVEINKMQDELREEMND
jgi:hypothetical protein